MMKSGTVAIALVLALLAQAAHAQTAAAYPTRTIKFIVGFAAGGGVDIVARLVAQKMQESFGQTVIVENRPGGNAMLGPDIAAKSAPDGYTLLYAAAGQMSVSPAIYTKIPYQPLKDFVPISMLASYPYPEYCDRFAGSSHLSPRVRRKPSHLPSAKLLS